MEDKAENRININFYKNNYKYGISLIFNENNLNVIDDYWEDVKKELKENIKRAYS